MKNEEQLGEDPPSPNPHTAAGKSPGMASAMEQPVVPPGEDTVSFGRQGRSQDIADARAQHGQYTFVRNSAKSAETFRRTRTCSVSVRGERIYETRILWIYLAILRCSISRPLSA